MKKTLLVALLALASSTAFAQVDKVKSVLTSKSWKVELCTISGVTPAAFSQSNNIKGVDVFRIGDRYIFRPDGTYTIVSTVGGNATGIWQASNAGVTLDPGKAGGGTQIMIPNAMADGWQGRIIRRLGMCSVTSLYEVIWTPAAM